MVLRAVFVRSADPGLVGLGESGRRAGARDRNAARSARPTDADDPPAPSARHRTRDGARRGAPHADVAPEKNKEDDNTCRAESHRRRRSRSADTTPPSSSPAIGGRLRGQRGFTRVKLWESRERVIGVRISGVRLERSRISRARRVDTAAFDQMLDPTFRGDRLV